MPTAASLVAAICLAIAAYFISLQVMPLMPEGTYFGNFIVINVLVGVVVGWLAMGRRAGRGTTSAINNGITGVFLLMLWGIGIHATNEMTQMALKKRYHNVFEAITAIFEIGAEFAVMIATVPVALTLIAAALVAGLATEFASNRWR